LLQLHRIDPAVPLEDQIGTLRDLREEGKIDLIGLSEVAVGELDAASDIVEIASVQNLYTLTERRAQKIVDVAARRGIAFIPWYPLATGNLADPRSTAG
jgi:pyridoxine 4-dehydrogenase